MCAGKPFENVRNWNRKKRQEIPEAERCFPFITGALKDNLGIRKLIEVVARNFYSSTPEGQSELCGQVFKVEYSERKRRRSCLCACIIAERCI